MRLLGLAVLTVTAFYITSPLDVRRELCLALGEELRCHAATLKQRALREKFILSKIEEWEQEYAQSSRA